MELKTIPTEGARVCHSPSGDLIICLQIQKPYGSKSHRAPCVTDAPQDHTVSPNGYRAMAEFASYTTHNPMVKIENVIPA